MKYYPSNNKSFYIREVYECTYESINDYILDTMIWESRVDELHTIWMKGKDPKKETLKELIDKNTVLPEKEMDIDKIKKLAKKVVS